MPGLHHHVRCAGLGGGEGLITQPLTALEVFILKKLNETSRARSLKWVMRVGTEEVALCGWCGEKSRDPPLLSSSAYISSLFFYFPRHSFSVPLLDKWKATTYSGTKCMAAGAELFASALLHTWQPRWFDSCQASAWSAADICEIWPTAKSSADGPAATQCSVMLDMSL